MITIRDWLVCIPEEERHLAFVGEHQSVVREFFLTGGDWQRYADWGFHLDMGFDLTSVTTRDVRENESATVQSTEQVSETEVTLSSVTTKERFTVEDVQVDCWSESDIAALQKTVQPDGIRLVWTVLRQHTQLPGKLRATVRALGPQGEVKKSEMMVFEVEAAVSAEAAADLPQSEFEALEAQVDAVLQNAQQIEHHLEDAADYARSADEAANRAQQVQLEVDGALSDFDRRVQAAEETADDAGRTATQAKTYGDDLGGQVDSGLARLTQLQNALAAIVPLFTVNESANRLDVDTLTYQQTVDNSGELDWGDTDAYLDSFYALTDYIPVVAGEVLSYQYTSADTGARVAERVYWDGYDRNRQRIESHDATEWVAPAAGTAYVRLYLPRNGSDTQPAVVRGTAELPYTAYQPPCQLDARYVTVDETFSQTSKNPVQNQALTRFVNESILPYLLPQTAVSDMAKLLRVSSNGKGFELCRLREDAFVQQTVLPRLLPQVTSSDDEKILKVVNGKWKAVSP